MSLDDVLTALDQIGATSSRTGKEDLLRSYLQDEVFSKVVLYALDPYRTYGLLPQADRHGTGGFSHIDRQFFELLDLLAARELTGQRAIETVNRFLEDLSPASGQLLVRVLRKDLRAGFTATTVNKVQRGAIPSFACMLAHPYDPKRIKEWPVAVQPKLDGVRVLIQVDPKVGTVRFFSRKGHEDFADFPHIADHLMEVGALYNSVFWLDGEVTSGGFNKTISDVRKKGTICSDAVIHVFEILGPEQFANGTDTPHWDRYTFLVKRDALFDSEHVKPIPQWFAHSDEEIQDLYRMIRSEGGEGVIVKPLDGRYVPKRSYDWMKIKAQETLDLPVVGVFEGEGKYAGKLGGLIVDHDGVRVRVGGGFTDQDREDLWLIHLDDLRREDEAAFYSRPFSGSVIGRLIEVEFHEVTPDGSLRHPRFVRFRDDKPHHAE